jgi:hypothetical protein
MRIGKSTNAPFIDCLQGAGGTDQFTRSATYTGVPVESDLAKQKRRCYEDRLSAEHVNHHHVIIKKGYEIKGCVSDEVSGREGQCDHEDWEII